MTTRIYHSHKLSVGAKVSLDDDAALHVNRVLRLARDDNLILFNGDGHDYSATIVESARSGVQARVTCVGSSGTESPIHVCILHGICRTQRMDWAIQKTTELGVACIRPVICARSVVRLDARRRETKRRHWEKVTVGACEQSGRATLPDVEAVADLPAALAADAVHPRARMLFTMHGEASVESALDGARNVSLLIGPEGGLTEAEIRLAKDAGFVSVGLGPRTLRSETAPIAALSIIQYLAGDLRQ